MERLLRRCMKQTGPAKRVHHYINRGFNSPAKGSSGGYAPADSTSGGTHPRQNNYMKPILVIGGGIAGVTAAVELAEAGREVVLLEKGPYLGGNVVRMHNYFPKLCPPACGMEINFRRLRNNSRVTIKTHTEVLAVEGIQGDMKVKVRQSGMLVNDRCTACGDCIGVCPETRSDAFNYGFGQTRAIYHPQPLSFPRKYEIDQEACMGISCSKCVEACRYGAIDLESQPQEDTLEVHAVVMATGWKNYDASLLAGLGYDTSADVVTNVEFERLLSVTGPGEGKLKRPSDGKEPSSVAFVQCAGSRDRNHLHYCSAVCCSASLKHALNISELLPETKVTIFYIDLRVTGRNEDFLTRVEGTPGITLTKGKVAAVETDVERGQLLVTAENIEAGKKETLPFDMVVLATGIVPSNGIPVEGRGADGFMTGRVHPGVYPVGCAVRPMDVSSTGKDAAAAAVKAMKE